ncbi:MAG: hypothetical protein KA783_12905 [Chitinophagales bacterium]|nr:hypothetical protein [Sphingobacteriales bacterium]MBP7535342.1 hypothetical protein [Chitinophagales bacterium]
MLLQKIALGKIIASSYQHPLPEVDVADMIEQFVALLQYRVTHKGIEDKSDSLLNELFAIRMAVAHLPYTNDWTPDINNNSKAKNRLESTLANAQEVYNQIITPSKSSIKNTVTNTPFNKTALPTLKGLYYLQSLQPSYQMEQYLSLLTASLQFDLYCIIAELVKMNELHLSENETNNLIKQIKKSIVDFGVYAALSNQWEPKHEDETPIVRNIKIRIAAYRLDNNMGQTITTEQIHQLINS